MTAALVPTPLTDAQYQEQIRAVLGSIEAQVDAWLDAGVIDIDSARTGGMLELVFPDRSKIVVNAQPPLHELWLAARLGGYHFKYVEGRWLDTKDGGEFFEKLSNCASEHAGKALRFRPA